MKLGAKFIWALPRHAVSHILLIQLERSATSLLEPYTAQGLPKGNVTKNVLCVSRAEQRTAHVDALKARRCRVGNRVGRGGGASAVLIDSKLH